MSRVRCVSEGQRNEDTHLESAAQFYRVNAPTAQMCSHIILVRVVEKILFFFSLLERNQILILAPKMSKLVAAQSPRAMKRSEPWFLRKKPLSVWLSWKLSGPGLWGRRGISGSLDKSTEGVFKGQRTSRRPHVVWLARTMMYESPRFCLLLDGINTKPSAGNKEKKKLIS